MNCDTSRLKAKLPTGQLSGALATVIIKIELLTWLIIAATCNNTSLMKKRFKTSSGIFQNVFALLFLFALQAQGRVYVVTDTNDTTRITSLRGAIIDANRHGGNNTIILGQQFGRWNNQQPVFHLTISSADKDTARTGDLDITRGKLTVSGASSKATIDATGLGDRVFQVFSNAHLTLENLIITGGTAPGGGQYFIASSADEPGGAIYNDGTLIIRNCIIVGNAAGNGSLNWIKDERFLRVSARRLWRRDFQLGLVRRE